MFQASFYSGYLKIDNVQEVKNVKLKIKDNFF